MGEQLILRCENSLEGIFSAISDALEHRQKMENAQLEGISIVIGDEGEKSAEEQMVTTDAQKVEALVRSIQSKLGFSVYDSVLRVLCHYDEGRASIVFRYLTRSFARGSGVTNQMDSTMLRIVEMSRRVESELKKLYSFLNFRKHGEILLAEIEPKCNLIPLIMDHFADRFSNEDFIIFDVRRKSMVMHEAFQPCVVFAGIQLPAVDEGDDYYQNLWEQCSTSTEMKARNSKQAKSNSLPSWYRIYIQ